LTLLVHDVKQGSGLMDSTWLFTPKNKKKAE